MFDGFENLKKPPNEMHKKVIEKYTFVSADEIEMYAILHSDMNELLSVNSPVGKALLGHRAGDTVSVTTPVCTIDFNIKSVYKYN